MSTASEKDLVPPASVARNAAKGLELRSAFKRGGTRVGVARANQLKRRDPLSPETVKRMRSYFARHDVDKRGRNFGNDDDPSAGYVAWLLWGGDDGREWAGKAYDRLKADGDAKAASKGKGAAKSATRASGKGAAKASAKPPARRSGEAKASA